MVYLLVLVVWLLVGAVVGVIEARHGAWRRGWVASAVFGPFAIPLAMQRWREPRPGAEVLAPSRARRGPVDLLIGVDGSPSSMHAAALALALFGPRIRRVTLAAVLDVDTAAADSPDEMYPDAWPEEQLARARLDEAVRSLERTFRIRAGSVILTGPPADALEEHAIAEGYEVIVAGSRGRGLSKLLLGSCASKLARKTKVPVLLIPAEPAVTAPAAGSVAPAAVG